MKGMFAVVKYSYDARVGYSEISENGTMTLGAIVDRLQDCSNFHSEEVGAGWEYMQSINRAWLVNSWQIIFDKPLSMGDYIKVHTWAYGYDKILAYRNYLLENDKGEACVRAHTRWVLLDVEKNKAVKINESDVSMYEMGEKLDMDYADRRIKISKEPEKIDEIKIRGYQLDTNSHVNNSWYIKIAADYISNDKKVSQIRVEYKKAAVKNDIMNIKHIENDGKDIIVMTDKDDKTFCVVEFSF